MANEQKGETVLELPDGEQYTLVLNTNAMVAIETKLRVDEGQSVSWEAFQARITQERSVAAVRLLLWGMARKYHSALTIEGAGDVLDKAGGWAAVRAVIAAAVDAAKPDATDLKALGLDKEKPARPRKAQARTLIGGGGSISPHVARA